ncbi:MAG: D-alanyl-D-alanine carboxypeptidase [Ruminococcus sp.]|nr:D-alanyl-D-alanine carboxypeptidase [Ruminococcus sp.]
MKNSVILAAAGLLILVVGLSLLINKTPDSVPVQNTPENITTEILTTTAITTASTTTAVSTAKTITIPPVKISGCTSAMVYCLERDKIIFSQEIGRIVAPASLTKLLTACTVLEYIQPETIYTVGSELYLVQPDSSLCQINQGQQLTVKQLITGMMMASGNDAAYTLAVNTVRNLCPDTNMTDYQAVEKFCVLMNELAAQLGMENSHFVNPDGWDNSEQYTTAYDLCMLARYASTFPEIREAASCSEKQITLLSGEVFNWHNSNKLLDPQSEFYNKNVSGLKTGTTLNAGNCLISLFEINGLSYLSIVTGCETDYDRYNLTLRLINEYT